MLWMLKVDLGITTTAYDERLTALLQTAAEAIEKEGITLGSTIGDGNQQVMYAAYLWRKRDTSEAMPRALRWMMNNRLFEEKVTQDV